MFDNKWSAPEWIKGEKIIPGSPSIVRGITPNSINRTLKKNEKPSMSHKAAANNIGNRIVFNSADFFNLFSV